MRRPLLNSKRFFFCSKGKCDSDFGMTAESSSDESRSLALDVDRGTGMYGITVVSTDEATFGKIGSPISRRASTEMPLLVGK